MVVEVWNKYFDIFVIHVMYCNYACDVPVVTNEDEISRLENILVHTKIFFIVSTIIFFNDNSLQWLFTCFFIAIPIVQRNLDDRNIGIP